MTASKLLPIEKAKLLLEVAFVEIAKLGVEFVDIRTGEIVDYSVLALHPDQRVQMVNEQLDRAGLAACIYCSVLIPEENLIEGKCWTCSGKERRLDPNSQSG